MLLCRSCPSGCTASKTRSQTEGVYAITLQADLFEYLCLEAQQQRRDVELNALEPQVGSEPLTPPQLAQIQEARKQHTQHAAANQRQAAVHRQEPM